MKIDVDSSTLTGKAKGLAVNKITGTTSGTAVGGGKKAYVEFKYDDSDPTYAINYKLPTRLDKDSYLFTPSGNLTDFEWEKTWEIVKMQIDLIWDTKETTDKNGAPYMIAVLAHDRNVIDYDYYLWDENTNSIVGGKLTEDDIEVEENVGKYYVVKARIKAGQESNVEFSGIGDEISPPFEVGTSASAVEVKLANDTLTYNGNAQPIKLRITGTLSESNLDIVYFDRDGSTPLGGAPKDAGKYRVEVSIKSDVDGFYLTGDNVDEEEGIAIMYYEIKKLSIDGSDSNWTDVRKPPSLQITKKQLAGIRYEYQDPDGNNIAFESIKAGDGYKIRAVLTNVNNYEFIGGGVETNWQEFSISANDKLSNPADPDLY